MQIESRVHVCKRHKDHLEEQHLTSCTKLTICEDTLLHGETLLVIASRDAEDVSLPFFTKGICFYFMAHAPLKESTQFLVIIKLKELLAPRCGVGHI